MCPPLSQYKIARYLIDPSNQDFALQNSRCRQTQDHPRT